MGAPAANGVLRDEPPTVSGALDRMVDAAQQVVVDQVVLARLDAQAALARAVRDGALMVVGGVLLLVGWMFAMAALYGVLRQRLPPEAGLGIIAAGNVVLATAFIGLGMSRLARSGREGETHGRT